MNGSSNQLWFLWIYYIYELVQTTYQLILFFIRAKWFLYNQFYISKSNGNVFCMFVALVRDLQRGIGLI